MLIVSMLLVAAPMAIDARTVDNPFATGATAGRTAKRRPGPKLRRAAGRGAGSAAGAYYANCAAARAAGAAPVMRGEPGYSSRLDRDGDGVGCE